MRIYRNYPNLVGAWFITYNYYFSGTVSMHLVRSLIFKTPNLSAHLNREKKIEFNEWNFFKKNWLHVRIAINVFLLYSSIRGANLFFIFSVIVSFEFWNIIFAEIFKQTTLLKIGRVSFWTCNSTPNFPSMLNKKVCQFRQKFWRLPTVTDSLLINAIAY